MVFHQPHNSLSAYNYNSRIYTDDVWDYHFHKSFEVIYVIKGSVLCSINNSEKHLTAGEFGMCLPNEVHSLRPEPDSIYWVAVFSADYVRAFSGKVEGKCGTDFRFSCSDSVKKFIEENLINQDVPPLFMLKSCLYALCNEYLDSVELHSANKNRKQNMVEIIDFISEHHTENIGLSHIADLLGYDYNYVSRFFHSTFNMSFKEYLTTYRLGTALRLLEEGNTKIVDAAYESGFQSVRTFNHCFRKHFGVNPSEYMKNFVP